MSNVLHEIQVPYKNGHFIVDWYGNATYYVKYSSQVDNKTIENTTCLFTAICNNRGQWLAGNWSLPLNISTMLSVAYTKLTESFNE